jgi:hypothetical protein
MTGPEGATDCRYQYVDSNSKCWICGRNACARLGIRLRCQPLAGYEVAYVVNADSARSRRDLPSDARRRPVRQESAAVGHGTTAVLIASWLTTVSIASWTSERGKRWVTMDAVSILPDSMRCSAVS